MEWDGLTGQITILTLCADGQIECVLRQTVGETEVYQQRPRVAGEHDGLRRRQAVADAPPVACECFEWWFDKRNVIAFAVTAAG